MPGAPVRIIQGYFWHIIFQDWYKQTPSKLLTKTLSNFWREEEHNAQFYSHRVGYVSLRRSPKKCYLSQRLLFVFLEQLPFEIIRLSTDVAILLHLDVHEF